MVSPTYTLSKHIEYLPLWFMAATPLIFYPYLNEPFELPKFFWILFLAITNGVLFFALSLYRRRVQLTFSLPSAGFFLLATVSFVSSLFSGNVVEGITHPLGPLVWLALGTMLTLRPPYHSQRSTLIPFYLLPGSFILVSIIAVLSRLNILQQTFPNMPQVSSPYFTPSGIAVSVLFLMIVSFVMLGIKAYEELKQNKLYTFQILIVGLCVLLIGIISHGSFIASQLYNSRYGIRDNWSVMTKTLSNPEYLLLGTGPQNYLAAFTLNRPPSMNYGPIWNTRTSLGAGLFFHTTTTLGLLGLLAIAILALRLTLYSRDPLKQLPGLCLLIGFFTVPPNLPFIIALYILIYVYDTKYKTISINISEKIKSIQIPLVSLGVFIGLGLLWSIATILRADSALYASNQAVTNRRADEAYRFAVEAVQQMPFSSFYTRNLSRVQAVTAYALIEELQREATGSARAIQLESEVTALLEQSIRDGQSATVLNRIHVENWEQLASVYTRLIGVAQGADQWAIDTYLQVVALDPTNPITRYRLGVIYAVTGNTDLAISNYLRALELKTDYVEPYIGLAQIYASRGDKQRTLQALDQAMLLLPEGETKQQLREDRQAVADTPENQPLQSQPPEEPEPDLQLPVDLPTLPSTNSAEPVRPTPTAALIPQL